MKRKAIVLFIAVTMILWTATPSFAAAETREISANYSGITLYIDLEPVALLDANGNAVTPFIADGTTYLPVRAISEALGMEVVWEADTKSVRINEKPESVPAEQTPTADEPEGDAAETTRPAAEDAAKDADAASEPAKDADATDAAKDADATEAPADETAAETPAATEETTDVPADEADATESFVGTKALSVMYSDIAIYVNDTEIAPKDAGGNAVEPFIADGTTYLPVRAVAEALGLTVLWDGAS
ncbi:MAG: copper amine oxidase N-terminal domain-containing protein, partial [Clostridiales Family XIII bacterium]|nr:copper amine oxidase N-terminal domain-containing protein [Clostridiales Family XIII bacterium]